MRIVAMLTLFAWPAGALAAPPPPLEPVEVRRPPVPEGLAGVANPAWTPDGRHIVFGFTRPGSRVSQLGISDAKGRGFRCLTCDAEQIVAPDRPLNASQELSPGKPFVFGDGRRVLFRHPGSEELQQEGNPTSGPTSDFNYFILECEPNLLDCDKARILPLHLPGGGLTQGTQNREGRISPDSKWFAWTEVRFDGTRMSLGRLVRAEDGYSLSDVRVLNPTFELAEDPRGWAVGAPLYELKQFADRGRTVIYASFAEAENFDAFELDLETGERRRLTSNVEWDEDVGNSPDGRWIVVSSSHTLDRMAPFSALPRPPYVDFPVYVQVGRFQLNTDNRRCLLEPWLLDREGERAGYFGQPLNPGIGGGWDSRTVSDWSPFGNEVLFSEARRGASGMAGDPFSRATIARLTARRPHGPIPPAETPVPSWAPTRDQWRGYQAEQRSVTLQGLHSGTAELSLSGIVNSHDYRVVYENYSDDGRTFVSGEERAFTPVAVSYGRWTADLTVRGAHNGTMSADVTVTTGGRASGRVETQVDGRRYSGLPKSEGCQQVARPRLIVTRKIRRRGPTRFLVRARVRALVPGDEVARPVRRARVRVGRRRGRTNARGVVRVQLRRAGLRRRLRARAPGLGRKAVRLRRR